MDTSMDWIRIESTTIYIVLMRTTLFCFTNLEHICHFFKKDNLLFKDKIIRILNISHIKRDG